LIHHQDLFDTTLNLSGELSVGLFEDLEQRLAS
jgi:hypothetical protein